MPKAPNANHSSKQLEPFARKKKDADFTLEIEKLSRKERTKCPLIWPSHILVFGSTMAGKTTLISDILDRLNSVYDFKDSHYSGGKLIVVSPIHKLEIAEKMSTISSWDVELYNDVGLNKEFEDHLIKTFRLAPPNTAKILLLDDILTQANPRQITFLNKLFAYFRHENISIIATVHSYDVKFSTIMDQVGLIAVMYCLNTSTVIRNVLVRHLYKGTAGVWKEIRRLFMANLNKHDYICLNFTKESLSSEVFFVTNDLFHVRKGVSMSQILNKM